MTSLFSEWNHEWYGWSSDLGYAQSHISNSQEMVDITWRPDDLDQIVNYLTSAPIYGVASLASLLCPECGVIIPDRGITRWDNKWLWPSGLAHRVKFHSVRLPDLMVNDIRARAYVTPKDSECNFDNADAVQAALASLLFSASGLVDGKAV